MTHMPIMYQDYESESLEYADAIADNALDKQAELDNASILQDVLDLGPEFDFDLLGIPDFKLPEDFEPGSLEDQGQLDQLKMEILECPHCGETFEKRQAKVID